MLACYLEWHIRQALSPNLFDDHDRAAAETKRHAPVAKGEAMTMLATPTPVQDRAFTLLGITPSADL